MIYIMCPAKTKNKDIVVRKLQGILQFDFMFKILCSYLYACKKYVTKRLLLSIPLFQTCIVLSYTCVGEYHVFVHSSGLFIGELKRHCRFRV